MRMNPNPCRPLARALALSLVLHAALLATGARLASLLPSLARPADTTLKVRLAEPLAVPVPAPQPELRMREDTPPARAPEAKPGTLARAAVPAGVPVLAGEAASKATEQVARELFYPPEAIERGLEGEALVMLFLDAAGNAIAARIESSSGHAILDAAAVRAARTLRSLPASAPREALLPVRFRLQ